jgi:hypothetical protein
MLFSVLSPRPKLIQTRWGWLSIRLPYSPSSIFIQLNWIGSHSPRITGSFG